ncbi:TetR family transcriptional regulator [Rhodovulum imhoffii]|uniref:TetR family transcriptional regulator n=1 Tax=Rhodovulum imhoffii TaxID=365340 RepID=A0A2T5BSP2_9RHOB|nr:TetR/AcrR family transcriptional regulator [Rhodovulum imhoffii]MBK5933053.1 hypothetical protein [Rhodovulum imhoffii]PTN02359.1 TetR family transcriptional regulator [Rhodovulum imhoffii]
MADARTRILDAAEQIAQDQGARHLTLEAAARAAGVSKGGVLYHFPNKCALLQGMLDKMIEETAIEILRRREEISGQPNPTLRAALSTLRHCAWTRNGVRVALVTVLAEKPGLLDPARRKFRQFWADIQRETTDPFGAFAIWAALEGLQFFHLFDLSPLSSDEERAVFDRLEASLADLPGTGARP